MALINGASSAKKIKIKAIINSEIVLNIEEYCRWANIDDIGFFIEEAASFIFSKDKDWKDYQRINRHAKKQEASIA